MAIDLPEFTVTPGNGTPTGGSEAEAPPPSPPPTPTPATVPPNTSRFPTSEIATLEVNGKLFSHWESIWLQYRWNDGFAFFRFTAAEPTPPPPNWMLQQFKPGNVCTVTLAGQPALTGMITDRQTAYDANRHQVQLIGKSWTHWGYKSSVDTPTGNFDGMNLQTIFMQLMSKYPGTPKVIGVVNPLPFVKLQNEVGELTWDFLERLARVRGAILGADNLGNYLLIGDHTCPVTAKLQEGVNIKACECTISENDLFQGIEVRGHGAGSDTNYGSGANELKCLVKGPAPLYSKIIVAGEQPFANQAEACDRANNEAKWRANTQIVANIVVYGWTWNGVDLWAAGQNVNVYTPMAMLDMVMKIRTVTFEQSDASGTQTTLEIVAPWGLDDTGPLNVGNPTAPQAPTPAAQSTPTPPAEIPT